MSHLASMKTQIKNREALIRALVRMGISANTIKTYDKAQRIRGYHSEEEFYGNVIVERHLTGHFAGHRSDIGFELDAKTKTYLAHLDPFNYTCHFVADDKWQQALTVNYNIETSKLAFEAKKIPYTESVDEQGRVHLVANYQNAMTTAPTADKRLRTSF